MKTFNPLILLINALIFFVFPHVSKTYKNDLNPLNNVLTCKLAIPAHFNLHFYC